MRDLSEHPRTSGPSRRERRFRPHLDSPLESREVLSTVAGLGDPIAARAPTSAVVRGTVSVKNHTRSSATNLGTLTSQLARNGTVGSSSDLVDYYRFDTRRGRVRIRLTDLADDIDFEFLNSRGRRIGSLGENPGTQSESRTYRLGGGLYYVRVFPGIPGARSSYLLSLTRV